ncbi:MAG TPA: hypothetical protein ENO30_06560 [Thermodesulfobium narugense]|nr:hypothetical protein [Thermodesulfobium narugense]
MELTKVKSLEELFNGNHVRFESPLDIWEVLSLWYLKKVVSRSVTYREFVKVNDKLVLFQISYLKSGAVVLQYDNKLFFPNIQQTYQFIQAITSQISFVAVDSGAEPYIFKKVNDNVFILDKLSNALPKSKIKNILTSFLSSGILPNVRITDTQNYSVFIKSRTFVAVLHKVISNSSENQNSQPEALNENQEKKVQKEDVEIVKFLITPKVATKLLALFW